MSLLRWLLPRTLSSGDEGVGDSMGLGGPEEMEDRAVRRWGERPSLSLLLLPTERWLFMRDDKSLPSRSISKASTNR